MNREAVARELLRIAKNLLAMEFPTLDAMDKYLDEHPSANPSNHRVVPTKKQQEGEEERQRVYDILHAAVREVKAMDFPTQDAYDKYMKEHPDADKSNHRVVETKKDESPAKKDGKPQPGTLMYKWQEGYDDGSRSLGDIKRKHGNSARLWKSELGEIDKLLKDTLDNGKDNIPGIREQLEKMHTKMGTPGGNPDVLNKLIDAITKVHHNGRAIWTEKNHPGKP